MYTLPDSEQLVPCPYNSSHQVVKHRMAKHLVKCRRTHSTLGTKPCKFNINHVLPESDIIIHEATCPDRLLVERFMTQKQENSAFVGKKGIKTTSTMSNSNNTNDEEDWDKEECAPNGVKEAWKRAKNSAVIIHIQHGTPSERRLRRQEEEERLMKLRDYEDFKI